MSVRILAKALRNESNRSSSQIFSAISRSFSQLRSESTPPSFGIAFDIDGVVLRGETPIGGSPQALGRLYHDAGTLKFPYIFLTNGGGFRESKRALELNELLGVNISPAQVVQGHSPFKQLVSRFENDLVVAVGKGEPAEVMSEYGFNVGYDLRFYSDLCAYLNKNVLSIDDYASCFDNIDPLLPYKKWTTKQTVDKKSATEELALRNNVHSQRVQAVFIVSDSVDWSRDIQVLCDILRTGGLPGREIGHQPQLYFAHDDLLYQGAFPTERFGMGAFRIALEAVFNRVHTHTLEYTTYGKPNPLVFKNAEAILKQLVPSLYHDVHAVNRANAGSHQFKTLYMIGDNPSVDINGARQAGHPWFSILTRTGVFKEKGNHPKFPADLVVDTVEEAVDFILRKHYLKRSKVKTDLKCKVYTNAR